MKDSRQETVTRLIIAMKDGDGDAERELWRIVYHELRDLARRQRRGWQGDYTVNTTALVHEAYLKLVDQTQADWKSRAHFLAVAAKAMRHLLIDYARRRAAGKNGGKVRKVSFEEIRDAIEGKIPSADTQMEVLSALGDALAELERVNPRLSHVLECRFFVDMKINEVAEALGVGTATVERDTRKAILWLRKGLEGYNYNPSQAI